MTALAKRWIGSPQLAGTCSHGASLSRARIVTSIRRTALFELVLRIEETPLNAIIRSKPVCKTLDRSERSIRESSCSHCQRIVSDAWNVVNCRVTRPSDLFEPSHPMLPSFQTISPYAMARKRVRVSSCLGQLVEKECHDGHTLSESLRPVISYAFVTQPLKVVHRTGRIALQKTGSVCM